MQHDFLCWGSTFNAGVQHQYSLVTYFMLRQCIGLSKLNELLQKENDEILSDMIKLHLIINVRVWELN